LQSSEAKSFRLPRYIQKAEAAAKSKLKIVQEGAPAKYTGRHSAIVWFLSYRGSLFLFENSLNILGAPESGRPHTFFNFRQAPSLADDGAWSSLIMILISFVGDRVHSNHNKLRWPLS
jgi:hypothetical protein